VDVALISGQDKRRLQNASGGLSNGAFAGGTGEWRCCLNEPWRGGIIPPLSFIPRDDGLRKLDGICPTLADGDGTYINNKHTNDKRG
jgi:hypothetical protein